MLPPRSTDCMSSWRSGNWLNWARWRRPRGGGTGPIDLSRVCRVCGLRAIGDDGICARCGATKDAPRRVDVDLSRASEARVTQSTHTTERRACAAQRSNTT
jgi:hypothetical protein